jgi:hypothetical protein
MTDIITRLRSYADDADQHGKHWVPISPASLRGMADEIERLRTDRAGLIQSWNKAESNRRMDDTLLRQALEALKALTDYSTNTSEAERLGNGAIAALRERLGEKP